MSCVSICFGYWNTQIHTKSDHSTYPTFYFYLQCICQGLWTHGFVTVVLPIRSVFERQRYHKQLSMKVVCLIFKFLTVVQLLVEAQVSVWIHSPPTCRNRITSTRSNSFGNCELFTIARSITATKLVALSFFIVGGGSGSP